MFLKVGSKILNTENLVDAEVFEVGEPMSPYRDGQAVASLRTVVVTTTALEVVASPDGTSVAARQIVLEGDDANLFLEALPIYSPVLEER
ncbi:MAG: hypothetical protein M3R38_23030 [Actinomycetota bacterium]|nr:hypothetical protein [Actinomycetota bacterium]MDP9478518.1 hypothetical protein [Actinomycetota bacterium]